MVFYQGSISEAHCESRLQASLVFIADSSADTDSFTALLTEPEVASYLSLHAITIKLVRGTVDETNFAQIYPIFIAPSIYVIKSGVCVDVIFKSGDGIPAATELLNRVVRFVENQENQEQVHANASSSEQSTAQSATANASHAPLATSAATVAPAAVPPTPQSPAPQSQIPSPAREPQTSSRPETTKPPKKSESKPLSKPTPTPEEPKRVKINIRKLSDIPKPAPVKKSETVSKVEPVKYVAPKPSSPPTETAIAIRLPDGSTLRERFKVGDTLSDVRAFVEKQQPLKAFDICQTYPFREYSTSDEQLTLKDLDLVPSTSLVIRPRQSFTSYPTTSIFDTFLLPFTMLYGLLMALFAKMSAGQIEEPKKESPRKETSRFKTLSDVDGDGEDEKKTYNGNSTNQL
ncbi:hypothetical protein BC829DRAFT_442973 [Chytridium lagenaria]|nr:hypothetical protein BC829DRAFT_442973 [Chytridium lagenaria]